MSQEQNHERLMRLQADVRSVMSTPEGRRVMWWVLDGLAKISGPTWAGEAKAASDYNQGRRELGLELLRCLQEWAPGDWAIRLQEWATEVVHDLREKRVASTDGIRNREG